MTIDNHSRGAEERFNASCTGKMNSVSSEHRNLNRKMLPVSYEGVTLDQAKSCLYDVLHAMPRISIEEDGPHIVKVVYRTMIFEFFHDAVFYFDEKDKLLRFHSGTRIGFADFGSNKRWLQSVIARFLNKIAVYK